MTLSPPSNLRQRRRVIYIQVHPRSRSAESEAVSGTLEIAVVHRDVLSGSRPCVTVPFERVTTPTLSAVFDTSILEHPAFFEAGVYGHCIAVVEHLSGEDAAVRWLGDAVVHGEVLVTRHDSRGGCLGCCGTGTASSAESGTRGGSWQGSVFVELKPVASTTVLSLVSRAGK